MKKILIILVLLMTAGILQSQTLDTASWELTKSSPTSYYDLAKNKIEYYGVGVGLLRVPIAYVIDDASTIDTLVWTIIKPYPTSYYNYIMNIAEWYGYDSATVRIPFSFSIGDISGSSFDADSMWTYLEANTTHNIGVNVLTGDTLTGAVLNITRNANIDSLILTTGIIGDVVVTEDITGDTINATVLNVSRNATMDSLIVTLVIGNTEITGDLIVDDIYVTDTITAITGEFSGNVTADSISTYRLTLTGATEWIFGTGGTDRWVIDASGHFSPILDGTYDIGLTAYRVKMIYTDSLTVTENIITKNLSVTNSIKGSTTVRDTNSFDNQLEADTVTVTGAEATDLYWIQTMGQTVNTADYCVVEPTATGFIVRRSASGTANLRYAWWRLK